MKRRAMLFEKVILVYLLASLPFAPICVASPETGQRDSGPRLGEQASDSSTVPGFEANTAPFDPEEEAQPFVESPVEGDESPLTEESGTSEQPALVSKAGGAETTPISFQIPTQPKATVDQSTGALAYEYPIELPAGRAGMTPELSLRYNSRSATKFDSIVGLGWEISIPYIQREPVRGTQNLYAKPFFSSSISGNLIATTDTSLTPYATYRSESDDGQYLRYSFSSANLWTMTGKDGRTYTFGGSSASRQDNPSDSSQTYRWMLSKVADSHGNEIQYSYIKEQGQIYPSLITYTYHASSPAVHTVSFAYTAAGSGAAGYNAGFPVVTGKRLSGITVSTTIAGDTKTDLYSFSYLGAQYLTQSLLASVTRTTNFPAAEYNQQFDDRTSFSYSQKIPGWEQGTHSLQGYLSYSDDTIFSDIYTADFDLNGYPDVFVSYRYKKTISNYLLLNTGTGFTDVTAAWSLPTNIDLSYQYAIADLNGDRLPDLHPRNFDPNLAGPVYLNTGSGFAADTSGAWLMDNYVPEVEVCGPNVGDSLSYATNTFLYDIDHDGKRDLVYFGGASNFKVFLNDGSGWTSSAAYTFTENPGSGYDFSRSCQYSYREKNFQALIDLNGDGLEDYVHATFGSYLNTGSGFAYSAAYSLDIPEMDRSGLADINGDSLVDYISTKAYDPTHRCARVFLNTGAGFTLVNPAAFPPCTDSNTWNPNELKYTVTSPATFGTLMDVTADGLPDVLGPFYQSTRGKMRAISDGRKAWVANSNTGDAWVPIVTPSHGVFFDINTDGILDFIAPELAWDGQQQAASKVYMGRPSVPNRLVRITSALGAETLVEYGTAPTDHSDTNVAPMPVVRKVTVQNIGFAQPAMVVRYAYAGGYYATDPATGQRRFAGFHRVTATESGDDLSALRITDTYFHQANGSDATTSEPADTSLALIGKPYYTAVRHPSAIPKKETWQRYGTHTLATEPGLGRASTFSYPTATVMKTTESGAVTGTAEAYTYDSALGERTELRQLGFVTVGSDGSYADIPGDNRYRITAYAANPGGTIVKPSRLDLRTSALASDTVARTEYFYDGQPFGAIGTFGDLTKEAAWISASGAVAAETTYAHDGFGNVLTVTNPRGAAATHTYDSTNTLVASATNAFGHVTAYEYLVGKMKKVTDPNGSVTTYGYSSRGWLYHTTAAKTAGSQRTRQFLDGSLLPGEWRVETDSQPVGVRDDRSWQMFDNLGRPVRTVRQRVNHVNGGRQGYYLKESRRYDALGREVSRAAPLGTENLFGPEFAAEMPVPASLIATTTYDVFDRPLAVTNALGTASLAYAGPETTATDANGKTKRTRSDAYGNLVEVKEYNGSGEYTTVYAYDVRDLLTGVTDALGNVRGFSYNNAGWLTASEDLHAPGDASFGLTSFAYDLVGNQLAEVQPNGTVVTRSFDQLDRPTSIDGSTTAATDFILTYDSCTKGIGRLCGVSGTFPNYGLTFSKSFTYGATMPVSTTVTTLGTSYTTAYEYNLSDEVSRVTHPDGTIVRYTFGDWGQPYKVFLTLPGGSEATLATATYHHTLQPETIAIANGPTHSYAYDDSKLYRKASFAATMGSTILQSYAYSYDNLNNVTQVAEPGLTKTYAYDDLSRLIQAVHTPSTGPSTTYAYAYDAVGNITAANGLPYVYGGAGKTNPHAVTSIGSDLYAYDDNGNVVTAPNQTIAYTWQNQPASVTAGMAATVFAYDETGERFLYKTASSTEVQVSEECLVRGGTPEVIVKLGKIPIGLVKGNALYSTVTDHLGTPVKQVNASGAIVESTSYGPFGAILSSSGALNSKRGYTGHEEDVDSGLVYAEARYYSPIAQRFLQQDPSHVYLGHQGFQGLIGVDRKQIINDPQQLNSYSYARNNTATGVDPTGKYWVFPETRAANDIAWNVNNINNAAARYPDVSADVLAANIYEERRGFFNVNIIDSGDVPLGLIGVDTSIGLGQVRISTAQKVADAGYFSVDSLYKENFKLGGMLPDRVKLIRLLNNPKTNTIIGAGLLQQKIDEWKGVVPDIKGRYELLSSLYNYSDVEPSREGYSNEFGRRAAKNLDVVRKLLKNEKKNKL